METIIIIVSLFLLAGLAFSPILIIRRLDKLNVKYKFIIYLATGTVVTALITVVFAWWADSSDKMLLTHYGYNLDGMNETEFYGQVAPENLERVKSLETSIMGVGWPLKAIFNFLVYLPYLLVVYLSIYIVRKYKRKNYA